jgi:hypothetical protein
MQTQQNGTWTRRAPASTAAAPPTWSPCPCVITIPASSLQPAAVMAPSSAGTYSGRPSPASIRMRLCARARGEMPAAPVSGSLAKRCGAREHHTLAGKNLRSHWARARARAQSPTTARGTRLAILRCMRRAGVTHFGPVPTRYVFVPLSVAGPGLNPRTRTTRGESTATGASSAAGVEVVRSERPSGRDMTRGT